MKKSTGKLIVIDGIDGSGKTTQADLLVRRLRKEKHRVSVSDFPRYGEPSAYFVEQFLNGAYGSIEDVGPYRSALFFALDRYAAHFQMQRWLNAGRHIISNRYVTSNMGHQGAKIANPRERRAFLRWIEDIEFGLLRIPRPDLTLILHVPAHIAQTLVDQKKPRAYLKGKKRDLHEANLKHLTAAEETYREITHFLPKTTPIECVEHQRLLTPEEVHENIWNHVQKML